MAVAAEEDEKKAKNAFLQASGPRIVLPEDAVLETRRLGRP